MPLLAQRGDALRALRPLEVRPDRVPLGRIGRGNVAVDVQGTETRAGTEDQAAEGGDPRFFAAVERIATHEDVEHRSATPRDPGRDVDHRQIGVVHGDPRGGEAPERVADQHDIGHVIGEHAAHGVRVLLQGRVGVVTGQVDDGHRVAG